MPTRVVRFNQPLPRYRPPGRPQRPAERRGRRPTRPSRGSPRRLAPPIPLRPIKPGPVVPPLRPFVPVTRRVTRHIPFFRMFRLANTAANYVRYVIGEVTSGRLEFPGYKIVEACAPPVFINRLGLWSNCASPAVVNHSGYNVVPSHRPNTIVTWNEDLGEYGPNPAFHIYMPGTRYQKLSPDPFPGVQVPVVTPGRPVLVPHRGTTSVTVSDTYPGIGPVAPGTPNPQPVISPSPRMRPHAHTPSRARGAVGSVSYVNPTTRPDGRPVDRFEPWAPPVDVPAPVVTPGHRPQPPRPREKERKTKVQRAVARAANVAFEATETLDLIDSLWDALPENIRRSWPKTGVAGPTAYRPGARYHSPQDKLRAIYRHMDVLDVPAAIRNIIENHIEDAIIGRLNRGSDRARRRAGGTAGWGMVA